MLESAGPKFLQNYVSIEIQLLSLVLILLLCVLLIHRIHKMDLLRATQQKRFYNSYGPPEEIPTVKMLQAVTSKLEQLPSLPESPPLSSHPSCSSQRTVSDASQGSAACYDNLPSVVAHDFINSIKHRTCDQCRKHEQALIAAKASLNNFPEPSEWSENVAKIMLNDYEAFIDKMFKSHEQLEIENEVVRLHVRNLMTAFNSLQSKYDKAKKTIAGLQRNEEYLLTQLSKYETMFLLISDANKQYQEREMQKEALQIISETIAENSPTKDQKTDTVTLITE